MFCDAFGLCCALGTMLFGAHGAMLFAATIFAATFTTFTTASPLSPYPLTAGSFSATFLPPHTVLNFTCTTPNSYLDFKILIPPSHSNMFVEVLVNPPTPSSLTPSALTLSLYPSSIPSSRYTELSQTWSANGIYSLAVPASAIEDSYYYASVECEAASTGVIFAEFIEAVVTPSNGTKGDICANEQMHHYVELDQTEIDEELSVKFTVCAGAAVEDDAGHRRSLSRSLGRSLSRSLTSTSSAGTVFMTTKVSHAPIRLVEPKKSIENDCATFKVCASDLSKPGKVYLGLFGSEGCAEYTVDVEVIAAADCEHEIGHFKSPLASVPEIPLDQVIRGTCEPNSWVDYALALDDSIRANNLVFEASAVSASGASSGKTAGAGTSYNPAAISLHLFPSTIPSDRITQTRSDRSESAIFSVFKSYLSMIQLIDVEVVYVSVQCGAEAQRFTLVAEEVQASLTIGKRTRGEVCLGSWVYHFVDVPENVERGEVCKTVVLDGQEATCTAAGDGHECEYIAHNAETLVDEACVPPDSNYRLSVGMTVYEGALVYTVLGEHMPIRVSPPWSVVAADVHDHDMLVCDAEPGLRYYVGVQSTSGCSSYDIYVHGSAGNGEECGTVRQGQYDHGLQAQPIDLNVPFLDSSDPGEFKVYEIAIHADHARDNIVFEVELIKTSFGAGSDNIDALELSIFYERVEKNYETELYAHYGKNGIWSITMSSYDLKEGTYVVVVKCGPYSPVRYSVVAAGIASEIILGHKHHGEICDQGLIFHTFSLTSAAATAGAAHRTLRSQRREARFLEDAESGDSPTHLSVHIWRYGGEFTVMPRRNHAPLKVLPPFEILGVGYVETTFQLCDIDDETLYYIGLLGTGECGTYDLKAHTFQGNCEEMDMWGNEENDAAMTEVHLPIEHFVLGTCEFGSFNDFYIDIDQDHSHSNLVIEIEDMGGSGTNPTGLRVCLYEGSEVPDDRHSEHCSKRSSEGIYSVALSSAEVKEGTYMLGIRCAAASPTIHYRVIVHTIEGILERGQPQFGELCPGEWVYHVYNVDEAEFASLGGVATEPRAARYIAKTGVHARFTLDKYEGDFYALTKRGEPPPKLEPPFAYIARKSHGTSIDLCDIEPGHADWVGILGGHSCSAYDVTAQLFTGECHELEHYGVVEDTAGSQKLRVDASYKSSCTANSWVDFFLNISDAEVLHNNFLFEVMLDESSRQNPNAVTVSIFEGSIPENRRSLFTTDVANSAGVLSLSVSSGRMRRFNVGEALFLSVHCGAEDTQFSALALKVEPEVKVGQAIHGEVCLGVWQYFYFDVPAAISYSGGVKFHINKHQGSASFITRREIRPSKLGYPFIELNQADHDGEVDICDVHGGERIWLAVKGGRTCATFEVDVALIANLEDCHDQRDASTSIVNNHIKMAFDEWEYDECQEGNYALHDFIVEVGVESIANNLIVEVEQIVEEGSNDPRALQVFGFRGSTTGRDDDAIWKSGRAFENVYAFGANYIDLKYRWGGDYSFAVKCGGGAVKFRVIAKLLHAILVSESFVGGRVCPGLWTYHFYVHEGEVKVGDEELRVGEEVGGGDWLRFKIRVLSGDLYTVAARRDYPPAFNSINAMQLQLPAGMERPAAHGGEGVVDVYVDICQHVEGGHKYYVGLYGADGGCASYEVEALEMTGAGCGNETLVVDMDWGAGVEVEVPHR